MLHKVYEPADSTQGRQYIPPFDNREELVYNVFVSHMTRMGGKNENEEYYNHLASTFSRAISCFRNNSCHFLLSFFFSVSLVFEIMLHRRECQLSRSFQGVNTHTTPIPSVHWKGSSGQVVGDNRQHPI